MKKLEQVLVENVTSIKFHIISNKQLLKKDIEGCKERIEYWKKELKENPDDGDCKERLEVNEKCLEYIQEHIESAESLLEEITKAKK